MTTNLLFLWFRHDDLLQMLQCFALGGRIVLHFSQKDSLAET